MTSAITSPQTPDNNPLLGAALGYARRGWPVFPLHTPRADGSCSCGRSTCEHRGKHPRTPHGLLDATTDETIIRDWWSKWPDANIGVVTGKASGLAVLDLDVGHAAGVDGIETAKARFDFEAQSHFQRTGGGGLQCFFRRPDVPSVKSRSEPNAIAPGVELKADGGYVVVPPSLHASGKLYGWKSDPDIDGDLPELPAWALNGQAKAAARPSPLNGATIPDGARATTLTSLAGTMRRRGMTQQAIEAALLSENSARCTPPLPDDKVRGIAASIMRYHAQEAGSCGEAENPGAAAGLTRKLADAMLQEHHFAQDEGREFFHYQDGVYRDRGSRVVEREVKRLLLQWEMVKYWSSHRAEEVAKYILADCPYLLERPPLDTLNLSNGLLDVESHQLRPHSPGFRSPVQLPVAFDPDAACPNWEKFVAEVFPEDSAELAWEIAAWLMLAEMSLQKAILLLGDGGNGKSTYLMALRLFLGKRNTSEVSLHRLESDRFSVARLAGKLANICADLPSAHLVGTSTFKALVDGTEPVTAERKFSSSFPLESYARLIFSANHPPRSPDSSHAFFRRWLVVPFTRTFEGRDEVARDVLLARLGTSSELSGVLNHALRALPGLRAHRFTETPTLQTAWNEFRQTTDPVAVWLDGNLVASAGAVVSKQALRDAYNRSADAAGHPRLSDKAMGQALHRLRPDIKEAQRTVSGEVKWCWVGIGLRSDSQNGSRD